MHDSGRHELGRAGVHVDGVRLPKGMTVECAHEISHIVNEHERSNYYNEDDAPSPTETAVRVFEVCSRLLA